MKTIVTRSAVIKPMASYCDPSQQARSARWDRCEAQRREECAALLEQLERRMTAPVEAFPPAPEMPAKLALHQEQEPDPQFSARYLSLLIGFALGAASAVLFEAGRP